ncbi:MAG: type II toxin-antitoxin system VapC family toxin [Candidatus Thorarchaeota archaeon]|nr:type II toxin-antitoxin system VapC family toxin [Candidatus Thorarchaeota archaeon]
MTTKKIDLYLEASALWNMFYGESGSNVVEYCIEQPAITCSSSIWSHLEMHRAVRKRINQKEITQEEGENLRLFIDTHLDELVARKQLLEFEVTKDHIREARQLIDSYNLYASDALHLATTLSARCSGILVDDYHFTRLREIVGKEMDLAIIHTSMTTKQLQEIVANLSDQ